jgi:hypothetical protein
MENTTFAQQAAAWKNGGYALYPQCNDFYDWFCKDESLENRANKLKGLAKRLVARFNLDPNRVYVFFKNNCPMSGPLYDSLSICDVDGGVILWATPKSGHNGNAELYMVKEGKEISAPTFSEILAGL